MIYKYIYKTINITTGKSYVGQHRTEKEYDSYLGSGKELIKDIKEIGSKYFLKGIIEYCSNDEELNEKEKYWIEFLDTIKNGYNICKGGGDYPVLYGEDNGFFNKKHSEETKRRLSKLREGVEPWNKGKKGVQKASENQKKIASERHSGDKNWNYGKKGELSPSFGLKRTDENKLALSETKKGAKNPNVGTFEILAPDGNYFYITSGIPEFIKEHPEYNVSKQDLYHSKRIGEYKGWKVIKI
jgi:group I intron endonuclease